MPWSTARLIEVIGPHLEKHNEATLYPLCGLYTLISVMRCLLIVMKVAMARSLIYFVQFISFATFCSK